MTATISKYKKVKTRTFKFLSFIYFAFLSLNSMGQQPRLITPADYTNVGLRANFSPDGKYILTTSYGENFMLWEAKTCKLIYALNGNCKNINYAIFSPDGKFIATSCSDSYVQIFETVTGKFIRKLTVNEDDPWQLRIEYSPDGKYISTASTTSVKVWEANSGKLIKTFSPFKYAWQATFRPNGKYLLTVSGDKLCRVWNLSSGKHMYSLNNGVKDFNTVSYSPNGKYILTSANSTFKIWNSKNGRLIYSIRDSSGQISRASFSRNGKYILTSSSSWINRIYITSTGKQKQFFKAGGSASYSPNDKYILSLSNYCIKVKEIKSGKTKDYCQTLKTVNSAKFSPDGKFILTESDDGLRIWDAKSGLLEDSIKINFTYIQKAYTSNDGKYLIIVIENKAKLWNLSTGKLIHTIEDSSHALVSNILFSPDGNTVLIFYSQYITQWETESGKLIYKTRFRGYIHNPLITNDGKYFISYTNTKNNRENQPGKLWETATGKFITEFKYTGLFINPIISPDSKYVIAVPEYDCLCMWEIPSGKFIESYEFQRPTTSLSFNRFNDTFVSCQNNKVLFHKILKNNHVGELSRNYDKTNTAVYSPKGKLLLTVADTIAKVWRSPYKKVFHILKYQGSYFNQGTFSADGKYIFTYYKNESSYIEDYKKSMRNFQIWDTETGKLISSIKEDGYIQKILYAKDTNQLLILANGILKWIDINTGKALFTLMELKNGDYFILDKHGHYDGTPAAKDLIHYSCGVNIIEMEEVGNPSWEADLLGKLLGVNKEPIKAKKLSEIDICNLRKK